MDKQETTKNKKVIFDYIVMLYIYSNSLQIKSLSYRQHVKIVFLITNLY